MADPLSSFLGAKERGLGIQSQQFDLQQAQANAPRKAALQDVQLQRQKQAARGSEDQRRIQGAQLLGNVLQKVKKIPDVQQRFDVMTQIRPELAQFGVDLPDFKLENVTDEGFAPLEASLVGILGEQPGQKFQRGQGAIVETEGGGRAFATPVFDPGAGKTRVDLAEIPGAITSKLGETPEQQTERRVNEAQQVAGSKALGVGEAKRAQTTIQSGLDAAKGIPVLRRSLELLDSVRTGGINAALLRAKQAFGVESADEGELSANLGEAVLGDLRQTFGAAFTEKEGARLERIRAGFGKNAETNKRLINQSLQIAMDAAGRAMKEAADIGDFRTAQEIQDVLDFKFQQEAQPQQGAPQGQNGEGVIMEDANGNLARVFEDGTFEEL